MGHIVEPASQPKRCLGCGYILEGLTQHRCPECGQAFDPENARTYVRSQRSGRTYLAGAIVVLGALLTPMILYVLAGYELVRPSAVDNASRLCLPAGMLLGILVLYRSTRLISGPRGAVCHRRSLVLATAICFFSAFVLLVPFVVWLVGRLGCVSRAFRA